MIIVLISACLAIGFLAGAFYASWAISGSNWSKEE